jgi:hypothetical protein
MKTVTCAECGETVTKRSTLHIGNGDRICRIHEQARNIKETEMAQLYKARLVRDLRDRMKEAARPELIYNLRCLREVNLGAYNELLRRIGQTYGANTRRDYQEEAEDERIDFIEAASYVIRMMEQMPKEE